MRSAATAPAGAPTGQRHGGLWRGVQERFFGDLPTTLLTLALFAVAALLLPELVRWALIDASFSRQPEQCWALAGRGACWGVIAEKFRPILLGRYPYSEQWRALLATVLLIGATVALCRSILTSRRWAALAALQWVAALALLVGGWAGLSVVDSSLWGGLPLSLLLAQTTLLGAWPLAILLALARRSPLPLFARTAALYIETVRALPLVSILLLAAFLLPLLFPRGVGVDMLWRVMAALVLFAAAYLAEILRGGLQVVPASQIEAAKALGFTYWPMQRYIVLPIAVRACLPALVGSAISLFKETSLVTVVSVFELTGALNQALLGDIAWRESYVEAYLFVAVIYGCGCAALSAFGQRLANQTV